MMLWLLVYPDMGPGWLHVPMLGTQDQPVVPGGVCKASVSSRPAPHIQNTPFPGQWAWGSAGRCFLRAQTHEASPGWHQLTASGRSQAWQGGAPGGTGGGPEWRRQTQGGVLEGCCAEKDVRGEVSRPLVGVPVTVPMRKAPGAWRGPTPERTGGSSPRGRLRLGVCSHQADGSLTIWGSRGRVQRVHLRQEE